VSIEVLSVRDGNGELASGKAEIQIIESAVETHHRIAADIHRRCGRDSEGQGNRRESKRPDARLP
jgi:hypothetical protein